jgi:uncharacterized repeat protein (TIGR03803 family)
MKTTQFCAVINWSLALIATALMLITSASARTETVLASLGGGPGQLISDSAGNLYGTTYLGGTNKSGSVFKLTRGSNGVWTETVLHSFAPLTHRDGGAPYALANLVFDGAGNLYGTTTSGGKFERGTVFRLTPGSNGVWTCTTLHSFAGPPHDGAQPLSGLVLDGAGNFYGTTSVGGSQNAGTVFKLSPSGSSWTETVLYSFTGDGNNGDGYAPVGGVIRDSAGNLYGTTSGGGVRGGSQGYGTVFELSPGANGGWTESVLHKFKFLEGIGPYAGLTLDKLGSLYGTTQNGGPQGKGTVFTLTPAGGGWTTSVIHSFTGTPGDGGDPAAPLVVDSSGNLYGTTINGGTAALGTVFELTPTLGGWAENIVFSFSGGSNGRHPAVGVILDSAGNLFGSAALSHGGVVFEIAP